MYKGKFTAQVDIDISVDENDPYLLPFSEAKNVVENELCAILRKIIKDSIDDIGTVRVTKISAALWREALKDGKDD